MNILRGAAVLALVAAASAAGEWRVEREISGAAETTVVAAVALDAHVYANSLPDLADVRVFNQAGREVPRVILPERDYTFEERHTQRAARITRLEPLAEGGLAVECELERTNAMSLTQVRLSTPLRNYEQTVTVFVPGPEGAWRPLKAAEPLFDYSRYADVSKETVDLPAVTNRQFRLVIGQADDQVFSSYTSLTEELAGGQTTQRLFKRYSVESRPFRIDAVTFRDTERQAVANTKREERVAARGVAVEEDAGQKATLLTLEAGRYPVIGIEVAPEQQNFERRVTVEAPAPGGWRKIREGRVMRSRLPGVAPEERLEVALDETRAERLRVRIHNDDNPPLTFGDGGLSLVLHRYRVAFIAEKGGRYRLVYGNPEIQAPPVYEQGVTAYLGRGQKAAEWALAPAPEGAVTYGAAVRVKKILTRYGMSLLSVLVMAALGLFILRAVRHMEKAP